MRGARVDRIGGCGGDKAGLSTCRSRTCVADMSREEGGKDVSRGGRREVVDLSGTSVGRSQVGVVWGLRVGVQERWDRIV